jgi:hypothetical protein
VLEGNSSVSEPRPEVVNDVLGAPRVSSIAITQLKVKQEAMVDNLSIFWENDKLQLGNKANERDVAKEIHRVLTKVKPVNSKKNTTQIYGNLNLAEDKEELDQLRASLVDLNCRDIIAENLRPKLKMREEKMKK